MASNANQIIPLSLTVEPEFDEDSSNVQTRTENAHSSSFGDISLFSASTRPTSPECSPETSGRYLSAHWQSQRRSRPDIGNAEECNISASDSCLPSMTVEGEQQQCNTNHIISFCDIGTIDEMGFDMTFGLESPAVPCQEPTELNEEDQISLEATEQFSSHFNYGNYTSPSSSAVSIFQSANKSALPYDNQQNQLFYQGPTENYELTGKPVKLGPFEQFNSLFNYGNHTGPSSDAVNNFPAAYEPAVACGSQQNQIYCPLPAPSSVPPSISISEKTQEAVTYLDDNLTMSSNLSQSLPTQEVAPRVRKLSETKTSKGKKPMNRSRSSSWSNKTSRPGGRTHKMSIDARHKYGEVRKLGACTNCRVRKCGCDKTILCKACVCYFGPKLVDNRCRQFSLNSISGILLDGKMSWRPGNRNLLNYFSECSFEIGNENYTIPLKLGFGKPIKETVRIIYPGKIGELNHHHVVYSWPPNGGDQTNCKRSLQIAFPAELSQEQGLKRRINNHLTVLLLKYFNAFPHIPSQLGLLREIYVLYRHLLAAKRNEAYYLHQALRLLILVRISGEVTVDESDATAQQILGRVLDTPLAAYESTHPCYIRSQLGSVFAELARDLLSDILTRLEVLALKRECSNWHIVFSTFAVLFMAIELVQYQDARIGFHAALDGYLLQSPAFLFSERSQELEQKGVDILLHLYKVCFGSCNSRIQGELGAIPPGEAGQFLAKVRKIYNRTQPYLRKQSLTSIRKVLHMSDLFDRQVGKLIMTRPSVL